VSVRRLDRDEARQLAVRAQLLDATRPTDRVDLVDRLTLLQIDPTAAIAPNADLVAWSRLGATYKPAQLTQALEDRTLFELRAFIRPISTVALHVLRRRVTPANPQCVHGWKPTTASGATFSPACATLDRCSPATYRTPTKCRGARLAGRTTAT
jgi:uncharacterized protein YcaQ